MLAVSLIGRNTWLTLTVDQVLLYEHSDVELGSEASTQVGAGVPDLASGNQKVRLFAVRDGDHRQHLASDRSCIPGAREL